LLSGFLVVVEDPAIILGFLVMEGMKGVKLPRRGDDMAMRKVGKMLKGLSGWNVVSLGDPPWMEGSPTQKLDVPNTVSR